MFLIVGTTQIPRNWKIKAIIKSNLDADSIVHVKESLWKEKQ